MDALKLFFLLLVCSIIKTKSEKIRNGQPIEILPNRKLDISYDFIVPEKETYTNAIIIFGKTGLSREYININEDDKNIQLTIYPDRYASYNLHSIKNKTLNFKADLPAVEKYNFILLDITREIDVAFDDFLHIIKSTYSLSFRFNPGYNMNLNIHNIKIYQKFYFIQISAINQGERIFEYCYDENCLNNIYNSSKIINFKKESQYKIRLNYFKYPAQEYYVFPAFEGINNTFPEEKNYGLYKYEINQSAPFHIFYIDVKKINQFFIHSKYSSFIQYCYISKEMLNNLPDSLETVEKFYNYENFQDINRDNNSEYILIISKDKMSYNKNLLYFYNYYRVFIERFDKFILNKGNYIVISTGNVDDHFFTSAESNKPSLHYDNENDDTFYTQIINEQFIIAFNEKEDVEIKMRFYNLENNLNYIKSLNNDKLQNYLNKYGNSESVFFRLNSEESDNYGFLTYLIFDLKSEYYFYFNQILGNIDVYNTQIDDDTNMQKYLSYIKSYKDEKYKDKLKLINDQIININGSQLFSTFWSYNFLGDIYIQKVEDNSNIELNKNDKSGNLVKLLKADKLYNLNFNVNHLIKLNKDFSDTLIEFYNSNEQIIGTLNSDNRIIELTGENIKVKSNKNALIYLFAKMPKEKKLKEIIFPKDKKENNLNFSITNKNTDNEYIYIIKDFGFENHYPMLNSSSWVQFRVRIGKTKNIYIESPYNKLKKFFLEEKENYIIYIANAFDENGKPYLEEDAFEFEEINYIKNLWSGNNKYNFQLIQMNKNSSIVLSKIDPYKFVYQMSYCNKTSFIYKYKFDFTDSNPTSYEEKIGENYTSSKDLYNNEIINIKFYTDSDSPEHIIFYYDFTKSRKSNTNSNFLSTSNYYISYIQVYDNHNLKVEVSGDSKKYYKFYIVVSLVDEYNNLNSFNQGCYLTQLVTENINSKYIVEIAYDIYLTQTLIDISKLTTKISNNTFVINIIYENLDTKSLAFGEALEFKIQELNLYQKYKFNGNNNLNFYYNYNDTNFEELTVVTHNDHKEGSLIIQGAGIYLKKNLSNSDYNEIHISLNGIGFVNFEFIGIKNEGEFLIFPAQRQIDIIDFNEKNYIFEYDLFTVSKTLVIKYNITGLIEDTTIYFATENPSKQFEICEESSHQCEYSKNFYKFLKNKEYTINVYSYQQTYSNIHIVNKYIFGVFEKQNIQAYNEAEFGVERKNEPHIYSLPKINYKLYLINVNIYNVYYSEDEIPNIEKMFEALPNMNFNQIIQNNKYYEFYNNLQRHIFVIPKYNIELKSFENCTIGFGNQLYFNFSSNTEIDFGINGKGFILFKEKGNVNNNPLKDYNFLNLIYSKGNNMRTINSDDYYIENQKILSINSKGKFVDFIYIDKIPESKNIIKLLYFEPRFAYFYALDNFNIKNKFYKSIEQGCYLYFQRINTNIKNIYDFYNYITFDLNDKVTIYAKKYYGYSTFYEINNEKYNMTDISFIGKPLKTYENEISKFEQLFTLKNNQLYSGYLDHETLYDIYMEIDNDNNIVVLPKENNEYNNLMKLFKQNINYNLNFEINHLIKLDPNFDAEVTIKDSSNNNIIINKNNPITKEIKGNNVQITTNLNSILYFYSPLSSLSKKIYQYELSPLKGKNIVLDIAISKRDTCHMHYLIDFGFEGYSPFQKQNTDFMDLKILNELKLYIPNYYDKLTTILVKDEKLFLYYYLDKCSSGSEDNILNINPKYYSSFNQLDKASNFFVIDPHKEGEEKNLLFNFNKNKALSLQVLYSPNYEDTKVFINYNKFDGVKRTKYFTNSEIFILEGENNENYNLTFNTNNKFVLSYSLYDKNDENIKSYSTWVNERKINNNLILYSKINTKEKKLSVQFASNYIKSMTKYYIIIGQKKDNFTLDNFNDPCFLINLITENSNKIKIHELYYGDDEIFINADIDIKDIMSQNEDNQEYLVNIVSQELRFNKSLNYYDAVIVKNKIEDGININEDIIFNGESKYKLSYTRPDNKNQICFFFSISSSTSYKLLIQKENSQNITYDIKGQSSELFTFECDYDGIYNINIKSSSESSVQGLFKIFSTGIPFNMDINDYFILRFNNTINYQPSNLNVTVNTHILNENKFVSFKYSNLKINFKIYNETISNELDLFYFEKNKKYEFVIEFLKSEAEHKEINYNFKIINSLRYEINNLVLGNKPMIFSLSNYCFMKIDYRKTPKFVIETKENPKFYLSDNIQEIDFNSFPEKFYKYKFKPLKDLKIIKQINFDYAILLINFESDKNMTSIQFIDKVQNININFNEMYEIFDEKTNYSFEYNTTYPSDIFMLTYNFTKKYTGEILITDENGNKTEITINKEYDKIYLELSGINDRQMNYKINFNILNYDNTTFGTFKLIRMTGGNYKVDITQNIIEFDQIKSSKETGPLILDLSSLQDNYIKKFDVASDINASEIISIRKYNSKDNFVNNEDFEPIKNNYYYFEKNNNYYIQVKLIKVENHYILNPFKIIEFSQKNIDNIKESKNITYSENNIDKFILLDFGQYSKIKISLIYSTSTINMANITFYQYHIFPKDIQNITFKKSYKNEIEIEKADNNSYVALLINVKQNPTNIEIMFINNNSNPKNGLSVLAIALISVSCVIFVVIVVVIIIVVIKKKKKENEDFIDDKKLPLKAELMDISKAN